MLSKLFIASLALPSPFTAAEVVLADRVIPKPPERGPYYRVCPLPKCSTCPSVATLQAPGVGFALETSYGAAAVRLHDGTIHNIALIDGDASYAALTRRFATDPVPRIPDHFGTVWEQIQYAKNRTQRLLNKLVGRPATPETAVLASMVSRLLDLTQGWLGSGNVITTAVLTSADGLHLTDEEIGDVLDYLKIQNLMKTSDLSLYELYATSAAYVSYGKGVCQNYTDAYECEGEEWIFPLQRLLHLDLSNASLTGTLKSIRTAHEGHGDIDFVDFELGFRNGNWTAITDRIRNLAGFYQDRLFLPYITELILTGPAAVDGRFRQAVKEALRKLVADEDVLAVLEDEQENWQEFFTFATARGAAEMAKRKQEGPVLCAQTDECRLKRERVHAEGRVEVLEQQPDMSRNEAKVDL